MNIDNVIAMALSVLDADQINTLANYALLLAIFPAFACLLVYGLGSPWWRSALGSVLFGLFAATFAIICVVLASLFFPDYAGREIVRIIVYPTLPIAYTAMLVVILLERRGRRGPPRA